MLELWYLLHESGHTHERQYRRRGRNMTPVSGVCDDTVPSLEHRTAPREEPPVLRIFATAPLRGEGVTTLEALGTLVQEPWITGPDRSDDDPG